MEERGFRKRTVVESRKGQDTNVKEDSNGYWQWLGGCARDEEFALTKLVRNKNLSSVPIRRDT